MGNYTNCFCYFQEEHCYSRVGKEKSLAHLALKQMQTRGRTAFYEKGMKILKGEHHKFTAGKKKKVNKERLAMHTLKMSLWNKVSNHQESEAAEQTIFQNTVVRKLTSF